MANVSRIRTNNPNVENFSNVNETFLVTKALQNLSHISCVSIERKPLKVWTSAIMDALNIIFISQLKNDIRQLDSADAFPNISLDLTNKFMILSARKTSYS